MNTNTTDRISTEQSEIAEMCGELFWSGVVEWFGGMTVEEIKAEADRCWPYDEDNYEFALRVFATL